MNDLVLLVIRAGLLVLLWMFVLTAIRVVRTDLFASPESPVKKLPPVPPSPRPRELRREARDSRKSEPRQMLITQGALAGTTVKLGDAPITLGRSDSCTVVITDDYASNEHARLVPTDGQWLVEDLGSTNGTFLGRARITHPTAVPPGTPIRIGTTVLELRR